MSGLERVFIAKITLTVVCWAGPLLLAPKEWLVAAGPPPVALPLARLLGWAYVALLVGYVLGLREVRAGGRATSAVVVGIVSNAGAGAWLAYFGLTGAWTGWHPAVPAVAWVFSAMTLAIALGLYWYGLRPTGPQRRAAP